MKMQFKSAAVAAVLATSALSVFAQSAGAGNPLPAPEEGPGMHRSSPEQREHMQERMKERMARHIARFKADLKLTPEQDGAWNTYLAAMKPATPPAPPQREDFAKLTTPERLDKMRALRQQREAEMDKRDDATRGFYNVLNADQKKTFDEHAAHFRPMPMMHGGPGPR